MSGDTRIRWANKTWNPMTGCTQISAGCDHCYAKLIAEQKRGSPAFPIGFDPMLRPHKMREPASWKKPALVFVNSMSDVYHKDFERDYVDQIWDVMLEVDRHAYQLLTKRPRRMRDHLIGPDGYLARRGLTEVPEHIWVGTSIELDLFTFRAQVLREIPARIRMLSCEPLLGPLPSLDLTGIGWVIAGGESGPGFRTMSHAWAAELRDKCQAVAVPFFFKQSSGWRTEMGQLLNGVERWEQYPVLVRDNPTRPQGALL